jgi:hypothetical protein
VADDTDLPVTDPIKNKLIEAKQKWAREGPAADRDHG